MINPSFEILSFGYNNDSFGVSTLVGDNLFSLPPVISTILFPSYIETDIIFRNKEEILIFLDSHQEIKTYMSETKKVVRKYFPTERLEIELVTDSEPETTIGDESIFLYIITDMKPIEALGKLELLDEEISETLQIDSQFFNTNIEFN